MTQDEQPSGSRAVAGCAAAVLVAGATAGVATWWQLSGGAAPSAEGALGLLALILIIAMPIAAAHALMLGLPLYLLLRQRWRLRWWSAALGGFAVAVIPAGLLSVLSNHRISLTGAGGLVEFGLFGLVGGVAFWIVLRDPQSHGP